MSFNRFSCCYYPTRVLLVDDNKVFLKTMNTYLSSHQGVIQFLKSVEAAEFLKEQLERQLQANKWISHFNELELEDDSVEAHTTTDVGTFNIHKEIYNPNRFDDISVVVVDYAMPDINGIEFCRQFKDSPVKKILITGNATLETAIDAFNEGIIDKFLVKESGDAFLEKLNEEVIAMQKAYFRDISATVMDQFAAVKGSPFRDVKFCEQYEELLQGVKLKEYYMIDHSGSLLILDEKANPSWLLIKTDKELHNDYLCAEDGEDCPKNVLASLEKKSHIMYFFSSQDYDIPTARWTEYMHKAEMLKGDKGNYYYTYIESPSVYEQSLDAVVSFNDYFGVTEESWD